LGLSKSERIKHKKDFNKIYSEGKPLYSKSKKLKILFYIESSVNNSGIKAAFVVSKRAGKAYWRNRVKRLLREAYRMNKIDLLNFCRESDKLLYVIFSPNLVNQKIHKKIGLHFFLADMQGLIKQLKSKI
jgi:ribonuclease P protein component